MFLAHIRPKILILLALFLTLGITGCSWTKLKEDFSETKEFFARLRGQSDSDMPTSGYNNVRIGKKNRGDTAAGKNNVTDKEISDDTSNPEQLKEITNDAAPNSEPPPIEITWVVPLEVVSRYHIHHGQAKDALSNEIIIEVKDLEKIDDAKHGPVFRYYITGIPLNEPVYLTIKAENQHGVISAPADVIQVR